MAKDQALEDELLDQTFTGAENAPSLFDVWRETLKGPVPNAVDQYKAPGLFDREAYVKSLMAPGHNPDRFA